MADCVHTAGRPTTKTHRINSELQQQRQRERAEFEQERRDELARKKAKRKAELERQQQHERERLAAADAERQRQILAIMESGLTTEERADALHVVNLLAKDVKVHLRGTFRGERTKLLEAHERKPGPVTWEDWRKQRGSDTTSASPLPQAVPRSTLRVDETSPGGRGRVVYETEPPKGPERSSDVVRSPNRIKAKRSLEITLCNKAPRAPAQRPGLKPGRLDETPRAYPSSRFRSTSTIIWRRSVRTAIESTLITCFLTAEKTSSSWIRKATLPRVVSVGRQTTCLNNLAVIKQHEQWG